MLVEVPEPKRGRALETTRTHAPWTPPPVGRGGFEAPPLALRRTSTNGGCASTNVGHVALAVHAAARWRSDDRREPVLACTYLGQP